MEPKTLRTVADVTAAKPKFGEQFYIDPGFPADPDDITPEMVDTYDKIFDAVNIAVATTDDDLDRLRAAHTVKELRKMAAEHDIDGRSKMDEDELITNLLIVGVEL